MHFSFKKQPSSPVPVCTTRLLEGSRIAENPVPEETASGSPLLTLCDPVTGKRIGIQDSDLAYGLLAVAPPGGGKTNLFLQLLDAKIRRSSSTIIILDPKGDYLEQFGDLVPPEQRIIVETGSVMSGGSHCHNLFSEVMPRANDGRLVYCPDTDTDVVNIAKTLFDSQKSETQPVFPNMAWQTFAGIMLYMIRSFWRSEPQKLNNYDLVHFWESTTAEELKEIFKLPYMEDYRSCITYFDGNNAQSQGVLSYIGSVSREMFVDTFAQKSPKQFSMREVVDSPNRKIVFLEYELRRAKATAPYVAMLINQAMACALGRRDRHLKDILFVLDESLVVPRLEKLDACMNYGRSQHIQVVMGLQNISGLESLCSSKAEAANILASFQNVIAFRMSDADSRQWLVDRFGRNLSSSAFTSHLHPVDETREGNTLEEWEIDNLPFYQAACLLRGHRPFLFNMPEYKGETS